MALFVPKDRKSLFRQFLAGMYDAVVIADPNGHIIEINTRAEEYFGYTQDELIDRPVSRLFPGLTPEVVRRLRAGIDDDRHMIIDANGLSKSAEKFACEIAVTCIDLMDPGDLVFTIRNVERRRRLNDVLRAKAGAFAIAGTPLFACLPDGSFFQMNDEFLSVFGFKDDEALRGKRFAEVFPSFSSEFDSALAGEDVRVMREGVDLRLSPIYAGRRIRCVVASARRV